MYAVPDVDEVVAVAKELGIHLGPEEVGLYRKYLMEQLSAFDDFVQARLEEPVPPMVSAASSLSRTDRMARPRRVRGSHHTNQISKYSTAAQNRR